MILLFLGSWRSTVVVATSIPLSICCSILALHALGQTLNIMTLGSLALAVGILVDDATVTIENIHRNFAEIPGAVDVNVHQIVNNPSLLVDIDRTRADQLGLTEKQIAR
jgi:multidrug efflux pump subunit AcrB